MKKETILSLLFLVLLFVITPSFAQISAGGTPPSFTFETENTWLSSTIDLPIAFDVVAMRAEDTERKLENLPPRVGRIIPVDFTTENSGEWTTLPNGQEIWRLCIYAEDAIAIMLTYDKFEIPANGKLFIYNEDRSRVLGAYTQNNNPDKVEYATEFIAGDMITLEYVAPQSGSFDSPVTISGVVYGYNNLYPSKPKGGGPTKMDPSDPCMINVICPEGDNWTDQKKGVVRIITPLGGGWVALCSGTIVNNTAQNLDPLVLSAFHCYEGMSSSQINQSVYYFQYEHPTCSGYSNPNVPTMVGATVLVNIPLNGGSDGILLRLKENIPQSYGAYYNGWDRSNTGATSGVGIHHPNGDVKKISTFTTTAVSAGKINFGSEGITAANSDWRIRWAATETGYSVVQGGSSGSPLFNQNNLVVGTLSGGSSACTSPTSFDYYGKLWYHWNQMSSASLHMKPYLDPINSGEEFIEGTYTAAGDCDAASNLVVNYTSDCKANLTWNAPAGSSGLSYNIYRNGSSTPITTVSTTSYTDTGFDINAEHTWIVKVACSGGGESAPIGATKPACAQICTITASAGDNGTIEPSGIVQIASGSNQTFNFTPNSGYMIEQVLVDNVNNPGAVTNQSYTFTNVTTDHTISVSFKIIFIPVTNIINLPSKATAGTSLTLTGVVIPNNATNQTISWSVVDAGTTEATISGDIFDATADGTATVKATIAGGLESGGSYTKDFKIMVTGVGINDITQKSGIIVFPNPTTGVLNLIQETIDNGQLTIDNVEIFDIYGRKLLSHHLIISSSHHQINISHLAAGIYFLKIDGQMMKVIKRD